MPDDCMLELIKYETVKLQCVPKDYHKAVIDSRARKSRQASRFALRRGLEVEIVNSFANGDI